MTSVRCTYRNDDNGAPAHAPATLLKTVLLAYSQGMVNSRSIERACRDNVLLIALIQGACSSLQWVKATAIEKATQSNGWALRTALTRTMQHEDNTMTSSGPKAQGKSFMHPVLTGSLLRSVRHRRHDQSAAFLACLCRSRSADLYEIDRAWLP